MGTKLGTVNIQHPDPPSKGKKPGTTGCMLPHTHHWLQEISLPTDVLCRCWHIVSNELIPLAGLSREILSNSPFPFQFFT